MYIVKNLVLTLCLSSLCAGVLLHLFPDASAKRCMKAIAGLYVLSAVLNGMHSTQMVVENASYSTNAMVDHYAQADDVNGFGANLLAQTKDDLDEQYRVYFMRLGYDVQVSVALARFEETVIVKEVTVTTNGPLSDQAKEEISTYLCENLALDTVVFL